MAPDNYDTPDDLTLGEVWRVAIAIKASVEKIERDMDKNWLTKEVYDVRERQLVQRVARIEGANETRERNRFALVLAVVGAFVTAAAGIAVTLLTAHGGH